MRDESVKKVIIGWTTGPAKGQYLTLQELAEVVGKGTEEIRQVVEDMVRDKQLVQKGNNYRRPLAREVL